MGRFLERLAAHETFVGGNDSLGGVPVADVLAEAGMDFACLDTMFCAFDWSQAQAWARAGLARGMDPVIRLPAFPWHNRPDTHALAEVGRAFGIGMNGVCLSINAPEEVQALVEVSRTWQKNIHVHPFAQASFETYATENADQNVFIPLVESKNSIDSLEEILAVDGLRAVWIGLSDLSRMMGVPFEYEHPRVWDFVERAVETGDKYDVAICANPGYEYSRDVATLRSRIQRMRDHGIRGIWLQNTGFLVQWLYRSILNNMPEYLDAGEAEQAVVAGRPA